VAPETPKIRQFPGRLTTSAVGCDWDAATQNDFNDDLLNVFVANNFSWNSANNPEFIKFMTKWIPGAMVPDRRTLSVSILDHQSQSGNSNEG
jgi:hypothetical protein